MLNDLKRTTQIKIVTISYVEFAKQTSKALDNILGQVMKYNVSKSITGILVHYECPNCGSSLRSSLKNAGEKDTCPDCQTSFISPGIKERHEHEAQQSEKLRQKQKAKEEKQAERERQKQNLIEKNQHESAKESQREQELLAKKVKDEHKRKQLLAGSLFDISNHDWFMGGPYVYNCVEMGLHSEDWQNTLQLIINRKAKEGWEYFRSESLVANRPNGCLAALLGNPTSQFSVVVLVFRKPSQIAKKERSVEASLR